MLHELKTDPDVFEALARHEKTFELRYNDRDFKVGDILELRQTKYSAEEMQAGKPLRYTGHVMRVGVSHIMRGPKLGLMEGWVIMSIRFSHP